MSSREAASSLTMLSQSNAVNARVKHTNHVEAITIGTAAVVTDLSRTPSTFVS